MSTMTLDLPEYLHKFAETRATELQFATPEDYMCELAQIAYIEHNSEYFWKEIQKGLDSGPPIPGELVWKELDEQRKLRQRDKVLQEQR